MPMVITDGNGTANQAQVTDDGKLSAETAPATATPSRTASTVGTTSDKIVEVTNAVAIQIQSLNSVNSVYIRFGTSSATTTDWTIPPGGEYHLPATVRYTGEIQAIASGAGTSVLTIAWEI